MHKNKKQLNLNIRTYIFLFVLLSFTISINSLFCSSYCQNITNDCLTNLNTQCNQCAYSIFTPTPVNPCQYKPNVVPI
jgi:hypothetical protein